MRESRWSWWWRYKKQTHTATALHRRRRHCCSKALRLLRPPFVSSANADDCPVTTGTTAGAMAHELDQKIQDVYKKIQTERKVLEAGRLLRQATSNPEVLASNDAKIREAERSLSYFENTLRELQSRKLQQSQRDDHSRSSSTSSAQLGLPTSPRSATGRYPSVASDYGPPGRSGRPPSSPNLGPVPPSDDDHGGVPKPKTYTNLDLIKADSPHTTAKISRMLHQLEYKLQIEKEYKTGIDKMVKLYQAEGDKKSRADAEGKRVESERKIQLLQSALKRYKNLYVLDDAGEEEEEQDEDGQRKDNLRSKPLSGKLQITIKGARELDHAPIVKARSSSKQVRETYISLRVEGTQYARSHPSRTDRWNEDFDITVDKANELEIAIYDKQVSEPYPVPIGLLWIKLSDLAEAQRRQKVMMESGAGGWVTAGAMGGDATSPPISGQNGDATFGVADNRGMIGGNFTNMAIQNDGIDAWFAVEPAGALAMHISLVKENVRKRPLDTPGRLGRQGAVRQRKGEVHEKNGHKFVQRQFYQLMLCAFCNEFLLNAAGYQCEDCRYTCHKKCAEKIVTKCISKSNTGEDEEKINHRIPHRFEPFANIGANWCCHCGYMLPLGRKNARKCTECDITCHATCAHLVPDFCGMSMETANRLLHDWRDINRARGGKSVSQARPKPKQESTQSPMLPPVGLEGDMGNLRLTGDIPPLDQAYGQAAQAPGYAQQPYPAQAPPRPPPGAKIPPVPPYTQQGIAQPVPSRPSSDYEQVPQPGPGGYDRASPQPPVPPKQYPPAGAPVQAQPPAAQQPVPASQQQVQQRPPAAQQQVRRQSTKRKVGLEDFNFLAVLGKGNFGKVMLAEEKRSNSLYAIKVLKKEFIIDNDEVESTRSEKRVFLTAAKERHPFLLGLHSCFQTETRVYFVMEYVSGGDLMLHIQRKQFSLRQAKFYASEVLLALEYFHQNGIIYRDLKLDNILLTLDGHVKVADYGLCKEDMWYGSTTSTFCGTPEFMAPEILLEQRYGRAVDWWAFGVLTYEMLLGQSPFHGDDEDEIFDAILEDEPLYPITMPRDAVSILQKLLTRDPTRRLGSGKDDAEEIKRHPFFKDVNWDDVLHKRIPPPYFPTVSGSADTSNFDEEFTREEPTLTPVYGQLSARDQAEFNGFSWVASWADV
ncbi:hypothetical protein GLOTRDRAFT_130101 [Gloeophyllum trabeum ATCC 11539]|uniref:protein kinase C n=1 Tax=Gloeophyllum trabeum (strain ATCC 11539 / FP-39264 / Madison 617) TaxID=670483 RepID=S7Q4I7_GLOTA|nr:uncharacterized protein GLOTRDRAFT_130101 [Gloeophyllum trabeum ATCC 11539]EPQ54936.1 hypothetical protein GLOTRDRAFT_130101 [Gloeophyllum trabeum ATCC 11539]